MRVAVCRLDGRSGHEVGRALLSALYQMETGLPLPEVAVSDRGKPYFPHSSLHFSISHSSRHAFCVLSRCRVGIDAEELDRIIPKGLENRILSENERKRIQNSPNRQKALLSLWVLKEADAKRSGIGLQGFPNHTDFSPDDPRIRVWDGCLYAILSDDPEEGVIFHAL